MQLGKENVPAPGVGGLNKEELLQMMGNCLKLASENKITAQNTWSLPLIDNLPELIRADSEGGSGTNFQRASVTLDAGVKIYSHRVDSVHTETFKILGGLGRASGPQDDEAGGAGDDGEGGAGAAGPKRRRRTVELDQAATLEASEEALNVKKFDLAFAVDPLFHKTSAQFDEGGAKGLLLNNLSVFRGCEIVFDSMDVPERAVDGAAYQPSTGEVDLSAVRRELDALGQLCRQERISPTLDEILQLLGQAPGEGAAAAADDFVRRVAAAAGDVRPAASASLMQTSTFSGLQQQQQQQDTAAAAAGEDAEQPAPEWVGDEGGVPDVVEGYLADAHTGGAQPGLADVGEYNGDYDGGDYGGGGFDDYLSDSEGQSAMQQYHAGAGAAPFSAAKGHPSSGLDEDSITWLLSAATSNMSGKAWLGGSHWRYRAALPQASGLSGPGGEGGEEEGEGQVGQAGKKKRASRRKNEPLDFVALLAEAEQPVFEKLGARRGAAGGASKRSKAPAKTLLPEDHHYKPEVLARYALRPRNTIRARGSGAAAGAAGGGGGFEGAHLDFGGDYAAGGFIDADDDNDLGGGGADFGGGWDDADYGGGRGDSMLSGGDGEAGSELLSAPRRVEKVEVNYSRAAKQVDVRALKETLWEGIQQLVPSAAAQQQRQEQQQAAILSFQDVLSTVRERNPAGRLEDLSVHLCFICVLHLANEHGLVVQGAPELDRLHISNVPAAWG